MMAVKHEFEIHKVSTKHFYFSYNKYFSNFFFFRFFTDFPILYLFFLPLLMMDDFNLLKPTGYMMHQQFNIQQLYVLPTLYLCVLYLSEDKQRLVPLTA